MKSRNIYIDRLNKDLIGPLGGENENINERPSDKYLTGILYPLNTKSSDKENDGTLDTNANNDENGSSEEIDIMKTYKPASMGISFSIGSKTKEIEINIDYGTYKKIETKEEKHEELWERKKNTFLQKIIIREYKDEKILINNNIYLKILSIAREDNYLFTITLLNLNKKTQDMEPYEVDLISIFQTYIEVSSKINFLPRNVKKLNYSYDEKINDLIYRNNSSYVTGHTCSAIYENKKDSIYRVSSTWIPYFEHKAPSPEGDEIFLNSLKKIKEDTFSSHSLINSDKDHILDILSCVPKSYEIWLENEKNKLKKLNTERLDTANANLEIAYKDISRMNEGIKMLHNDDAFKSFKLAQEAIQLQFLWSNKEQTSLNWRPFQLGFFLMNIAYLSNPTHKDRDIMDLLWFPTGGGKTEAYLLIIAFILFHKRLSPQYAHKGGLTVLMRYTLRTLTVDQFRRASAVILACEHLRKKNINSNIQEEISIGLWVGKKTTPNWIGESDENDSSTPKQLEECPCCKNKLSPFPNSKGSKFYCQNKKCNLHDIQPFPVYTIDEIIYEKKPNLLIATIDKFAQIVRNNSVIPMFNDFEPELIIQDELHLISGPMGSISGMYEFAIDKIFSKIKKIKIIGSTATIKRADEQILSLYDRAANQFPPPIIDYDNSCFSKVDYSKKGRIYLGATTAGRSPKFFLQFIIASFLQAIKDKNIDEKDLDIYSTIVLYFNSLRELGGSIVLVEDDVKKTLNVLNDRRNENARNINLIQELTSRRTSNEIKETLRLLNQDIKDEQFVDVLLATNMLSVGVDIPRLGLMIVNGYPKSTSEYIQSTSRVGRKKPGLVLTLFNNNKVRDKSFYENFNNVHSTLYKSVEVTSVTPFAPRSRDKSIHAPMVAIYKIMFGKKVKVRINEEISKKIILEIIEPFYERVKKIDIREAENTKKEALNFLEHWLFRSKQKKNLYFWNSKFPKNSLLISAEQNAARPSKMFFGGYEREDESMTEPVGKPFPTPNTMRDVEPGVDFKLLES